MANSRIVWWDWDFQSGRLSVHGGKECILNCPPADLPRTAEGWEALTHPSDLPAVRAAIRLCVEGDVDDWSCEHRLRARDGGWLWVFNSGNVTERDRHGKVLRMVGTTQDVDTRHAAEETVQRDSWLLANIQEAIVCCDANGIINYWNHAATVLFGWTAAEMIGKSVVDLYPDGEFKEEARERLKVALAKAQVSREHEDWRKDGSRVWTEARTLLLNDAQGRPETIIILYRDISERKKNELKRLRLEQQLIQTQKMETMGTLAGGIAHDFNNIIAAILGFTEMAIAQNPADAITRQAHESILRAARRARDLVKRILTFSRFHEPERKSVDLVSVVKEASVFVRASLPSTVKLSLDLSEDCPNVLADSNQIHQVILNLAANSAHAMHASGGDLTLRLRKAVFVAPHSTVFGMLPEGTYAAIEVSDTGHGIEPETMHKIFDPFFTTKPAGEGTGLGLSIVHGIVEGHGGGIAVRSTPKVGTTFTLFFPEEKQIERAVVTSEGSPVSPPKAGHQRIAVVDDEEDLAIVAEGFLKSFGYQVTRYGSATDFYARFSTGSAQFDLIVTDQTMPDLTGLELARKLRVAGHRIPILIVSGYSQELTSETLAAVGRVELLKKPYERDQFGAAIGRLLSET
jgi:PAS domain S-box-containing protein